MLVLSRKLGEKVRIGDGITITIVGFQGNRVRVGIDAPDQVCILREELACWQDADTKPDPDLESKPEWSDLDFSGESV